MKVAAFQFSGSDNIEANYHAIERGIIQASKQNVRFMITQECALCGYPPVETKNLEQIDFQQMEEAVLRISKLAKKNQMYIGLGTILRHENTYTNSIILISPEEEKLLAYHKRALWGWDLENYTPGKETGIYAIDNVKIGIRICYEVRFPEYFRELFRVKVEIAFVSFCDVAQEPNPDRYDLIKSHLRTRAVENVMYIISVNSISSYQTAPTCVIDPDGGVLELAPLDQEYLLVFPYDQIEPSFGRNGRIQLSKELTR